MEKLSTKPTTTDRIRILQQYSGQTVIQKDYGKCILAGALLPEFSPKEDEDFTVWTFDNHFGHQQHQAESCILELKPLGRISDEDKTIVADICGFPLDDSYADKIKQGHEIIEAYRIGQNCVISGGEWGQMIDFLREKGYAVPYKNWSVEQLVEFGIFKLTE